MCVRGYAFANDVHVLLYIIKHENENFRITRYKINPDKITFYSLVVQLLLSLCNTTSNNWIRFVYFWKSGSSLPLSNSNCFESTSSHSTIRPKFWVDLPGKFPPPWYHSVLTLSDCRAGVYIQVPCAGFQVQNPDGFVCSTLQIWRWPAAPITFLGLSLHLSCSAVLSSS